MFYDTLCTIGYGIKKWLEILSPVKNELPSLGDVF